jgi:hypothetical protein
VQFAAFWLFLYTFFVIEKQENYFTEKDFLEKKLYTYLYDLK